MSCNKEISSCTAPEGSGTPVYHASGKFLNSGSNALRHILRTYKIKKIYVPYYASKEIIEVVQQECYDVLFYTVTPELKPAGFFPKASAILDPNYFGVCGKTVKALAARHPNLIVDNTLSFFSAPVGLGSFYDTAIAGFGLPDGGIAISHKGNDTVYSDEIQPGEAEFCKETPDCEENAECEENTGCEVEQIPVVQITNMSSETYRMLGEVDYAAIRQQRLKNFRFLAKHLEPEKVWEFSPEDVPSFYPYYTEDSDLRKKFEKTRFDIPYFWKDAEGFARKLAENILPLPIAQQFSIDDMKIIAETILGHEIEISSEDYQDWIIDEDETEPLDPEESSEEKAEDAEPVSVEGSEEEEATSATEKNEQELVEEIERTPEEIRDITLRRYRQIRMLPSLNSFTKRDMTGFVNRRRELMPLLREELAWLKEQQQYHENKEYVLTVLLVTYNHFSSISTALESILQQKTTYPYIIKILDDCSCDGTARVCLEYARLYPDKIMYCPEVLNSSAINITSCIRQIKTPYYTLIDGDDRWCCQEKIQRSLDFLETHPEYSAFTHDTRFCNLKLRRAQSYTHDVLKVKTPQETLTFDDYFYTHMTARVHRNNINWLKEYPNVRLRDIYLFYLTLDRGPFYYCDEIMSEYIFSGRGAWSKQNFTEVQYSYNIRRYMINAYTKFRHEKTLRKNTNSRLLNLLVSLFRKRLGWWIYTTYRKYRLLWNSVMSQKKKLDFIEYKHRSYPKYEQAIRDEIWRDRF